MKKLLFLTSFVFTTGGIEYKQQRLIVVTKKDVDALFLQTGDTNEWPKDDPYLFIATHKALGWFRLNFPNSKLISCMVHDAIDKEYGFYPPFNDDDRVSEIKAITFNKDNECKKQDGIAPASILFCGSIDKLLADRKEGENDVCIVSLHRTFTENEVLQLKDKIYNIYGDSYIITLINDLLNGN